MASSSVDDLLSFWGISIDNITESSKLFVFFAEVLNNLMARHSIKDHEVTLAIGNLVFSYRHTRNGQMPRTVDYSNICYCIGYLHLYAAPHSCLVREAMKLVLDSETAPDLLRSDMDVTFLGSGPGNDLVGFLSAIYGKHGTVRNLNVTAVDKVTGWEEVFLAVIDKLRNGESGGAGTVFKEVNVRASFLTADLTNSNTWSADMRAALQRTDLVFFVKVLSNVPDSEKKNVVTNVVSCMKPDAVLAYIDYPSLTVDFPSQYPYLVPIYQSMDRRYHFQSTERFGQSSILSSKADVRLFKKK